MFTISFQSHFSFTLINITACYEEGIVLLGRGGFGQGRFWAREVLDGEERVNESDKVFYKNKHLSVAPKRPLCTDCKM